MHLRITFKCNIMTGSVCVPLNLERRVMVLSCISGETDERSVNSLFFASTTPHDWIYFITYVTMCTRGRNLNTREFKCMRERLYMYVEFIKITMVPYQ